MSTHSLPPYSMGRHAPPLVAQVPRMVSGQRRLEHPREQLRLPQRPPPVSAVSVVAAWKRPLFLVVFAQHRRQFHCSSSAWFQ